MTIELVAPSPAPGECSPIAGSGLAHGRPLAPEGGSRRLTANELGVGLVVSTGFAWGHTPTVVNIALEVRQAWSVDSRCAAKIQAFADAGTPVRLLAVAARSGRVIGCFVITGLRKIAFGDNEGRWEFDLASDVAGRALIGHQLPSHANSGVRYFTPADAAVKHFLAYAPHRKHPPPATSPRRADV